MDITRSFQNEYTILTLGGQLWQREDMELLKEYFNDGVGGAKPLFFIFDLDRLTFVNSQAIGLLVKLHSFCIDTGGKLILFQPRANVREVIEVSGLKEFIPIAASEEELKQMMASDATK